MSQNYYRVLFKRMVSETLKWGKPQLTAVLLAGGTLALQTFYGPARTLHWKYELFTIIAPYMVILVVLVFYEVFPCSKAMYSGLQAEKDEVIGERDKKIREQNVSLEELRTQLAHSPEDERNLKVAREAIRRLGRNAIVLLRHLRSQGALKFGIFSPPLPVGMNAIQAVDLLQACAAERPRRSANRSQQKFGSATGFHNRPTDGKYNGRCSS